MDGKSFEGQRLVVQHASIINILTKINSGKKKRQRTRRSG
jgi:hypothetical protein